MEKNMRFTDKPYYKQPWYSTYRSMMDRCYRKGAANYSRYGGRGITVCDEWQDIETFAVWCEHSGYKQGLTIDRIDVNGNYCPSNCRWATRKQQANNRANTVYVTIDGITKTISEWAEFSGLSRKTINSRYCDGVRGVFLLHKAEDTTFKKGYNRYKNGKHYYDFGTKENKNNNPIKVRYNEEEHTYSEWSDILGIKEKTLRSRVRRGIGLDGTYTERPTIVEAEGE